MGTLVAHPLVRTLLAVAASGGLVACHSATSGLPSTGAETDAGAGGSGGSGWPAPHGTGVVVGQTTGGAPACGGSIATTTFRYGLCLCEDLAMATVLDTDGYSSSAGPYAPGGGDGSVGTNGLFRSWGATRIGGSLVSAGDVKPIGDHQIRGELHTGGSLTAAGDIHVAADAFIAGDLLGAVPRIDGTLHIPAASRTLAVYEAAHTVNEPVVVAPPCPCSTTGPRDIAAFVAQAAASNDNASIGLDDRALAHLIVPKDLVLPPGRYYVDAVETLVPITLHVSRPTALYVGHDLRSASIFEVVLDDPRGELDLFIGGDIVATGELAIGTRTYPSHVRTWVAGSGDIRLAGDLHLGGNLFAPNARILAAGPLEVFGSILAKTLVEAGIVTLHYDTDILSAGDGCDATPTNPTQPAPPAGSCTTCEDCNNQACNGGACGPCQTSADCCSPLVCTSGVCTTLQL